MRTATSSVLLSVFLCFLTLVLSVPTNPSDNGQVSTHVEGTYSKSSLPTFEKEEVVPEECLRREAKTIYAYGTCPDRPVSLLNFPEYNKEARLCAGMIQFGCLMQPVAHGSTDMMCKIFPGSVPKENIVCPGDKVIFNSINLRNNALAKYNLDLRVDPRKTDVYFLSDATASMYKAIDAAKKNALELFELFKLMKDVQFGVGFYRDESELTYGFQNLQSITSDHSRVQAAISKLNHAGGLDPPEANLGALYALATQDAIGWRPGSRRIIINFGDQVGHEPTCFGSKLLNRGIVINALKNKNIILTSVNYLDMDSATTKYPYGTCPGLPSAPNAPDGQTSAIASATGGIVIVESDQEKLIDHIQKAMDKLKRVFNFDDSDCTGKLTSDHDPSLPVELESGDLKTVTNTIELTPAACATHGKFTCDIKYTEDGEELDHTKVEFVNIIGCPTFK